MAKKSLLEQRIEELEQLRTKGAVTEEEYQARRAALLSATAPEVVVGKKGGSGIFKWGLFGCLGIFAVIGLLVIGLIVIIAVAIGNSADSEADSGGDVHVPLAAGASGTVSPQANGSKKSKVTLLQIVDNAQSGNQFIKPAAGRKWVGFEVIVENVGTKQVSSLDWTLRDSKDGEHDRAFVPAGSAQIDIIYSDLTPGGKKEGWLYFEIDADASVKWLRADPNPFLKNDLYFDAR